MLKSSLLSPKVNFPVAALSICSTHDSVSFPSDLVYARVHVVGYSARNLREVYTKTESYHAIYLACNYQVLLWLTGLVVDSYSYGTWSTYAASNDVNVPAQNRLLHRRVCFWLTTTARP